MKNSHRNFFFLSIGGVLISVNASKEIAGFAATESEQAPSTGVAHERQETVDHSSMVHMRGRRESFWIDRTDVTNDQFASFVEQTHYTTTAELKHQGGLVFIPPKDSSVTVAPIDCWKVVKSANWRHPLGSFSSIAGKGEHPVVQVSWRDAKAYAVWLGKELPTESEWMEAAGTTASTKPCNVFQGQFPDQNTIVDGFEFTSPVGRFPANEFGLYDMAGNVWQWCADDLKGGEAAHEKVIKGGSYLCSDHFCEGYKPDAKQGTALDTSSCHIGFRCVDRE